MAANKVTAVHATAGCAMRFGHTLGPPRRAKAAHFFSEQFGADEQHPQRGGCLHRQHGVTRRSLQRDQRVVMQ